MTIVIAVDPGTTQSGYVVWNGKEVIKHLKENNDIILKRLEFDPHGDDAVLVIEDIRSYGQAVGQSVFETVWWSGRFYEVWPVGRVFRVPRTDVKMHLCHTLKKIGDSNIRQALIDRFEPDLKPKQRPVGILKGITKDEWASLALAVCFHDLRVRG